MGPCTRRTRNSLTKSTKLETFNTKKQDIQHPNKKKISTIKPRRTQKSRVCSKKNEVEVEVEAEDILIATTPPSSPVKSSNTDLNTASFCCLTPKSEKYRIPEITTCPPAPKKRRLVRSGCSSLKRTPVSFYATPELELFFLYGLPKI